MEIELVRLIGAGLAHASARLSGRDPAQYSIDGHGVVRRLAAYGEPAVTRLIEGSAIAICRSWRSIRVPDAVALDHLTSLASMLAACPSDPKPWANIPLAADAPHSAEFAQEIAVGIVERARATGVLQRAGLSVPVCQIILESLFAHLLQNIECVCACSILIEVFASPPGPETEPAGKEAHAALKSAVARYAPALCTVPLLDAAVAAQLAQGETPEDVAAGLADSAFLCRDLLAHLRFLAAGAENAGTDRQLTECIQLLESGHLATADEALESAVEMFAAGAQLNVLRARFAEVTRNWPKAAQYYGRAGRCYDPTDCANRRAVMVRQAAALVRSSQCSGVTKHLLEAVQVQIQALGLVQETESPLDWGTAHVDTGNLLLMLAKKEARADRYVAAALHFKPAIAVLSELNAQDDWALAQLGLAESLRGRGEVQGDPGMLADATFSYRAALGVLTPSLSLSDWSHAKAGLGKALVRLAEETGRSERLDEAASVLRAARDTIAVQERPGVDAALGRVFVLMAREYDDHVWLREAVPLLRAALEKGSSSLQPPELASLRRKLASALWTLGETAHDGERLDEALVVFKIAQNEFAGLGDERNAEETSKQIANLEYVLGAMRRSLRHHSPAAEQDRTNIVSFNSV